MSEYKRKFVIAFPLAFLFKKVIIRVCFKRKEPNRERKDSSQIRGDDDYLYLRACD
jgi:hypothetical protein